MHSTNRCRSIAFRRGLGLILAATTAFAGQVHVPAQYLSIQAAVDAALDGDEVIIAAGTYNEALDLAGRTLTLRGAAAPDSTTLYGAGLGTSIARCSDGSSVTFQDMTFMDGEGSSATHCTGQGPRLGRYGGAIHVFGAQATVQNCVFRGNGSTVPDPIWGGSAIFGEDAILAVSDSSFSDNGTGLSYDPNDPNSLFALYGSCIAICGDSGRLDVLECEFRSNGRHGGIGAIFTYGRSLTVIGSQFDGNLASNSAGVMAVLGLGPNANGSPSPGQALISGCDFTNNTARHAGGAQVLMTDSGEAVVEGCNFLSNFASHAGGLIAVVSGSTSDAVVRVSDCVFEDNGAVSTGGGLSARSLGDSTTPLSDRPAIQLERCDIRANFTGGEDGSAYAGGLDVYCSHGTVDLTQCRIEGNATVHRGGGASIFVTESGDVNISNSIIRNNTSDSFCGGINAEIYRRGRIRVSNCNVLDNTAFDNYGGIGTAGAGGLVVDAAIEVSNSIAFGNVPNQIVKNGVPIPVRYSNVQGGHAGEGNIDAAPLFLDAAGGDFRLAPGSAGIDAGSNLLVMADLFDLDSDGDVAERLPIDLHEAARFRDDVDTSETGLPGAGHSAIVDIGACEFQGAVCAGDVDGDAVIDLDDLLIVLGHFGATGATLADGDVDGDGSVDLDDLLIVLGNFGSSCA